MAISDSEPVHRRSTLLLLVFGASLALVGLTAFVLVWVVTDNLTEAAIQTSVNSDRSLVQSFVASTRLQPADLRTTGVSPARVGEIEAQIANVIDRSSDGGDSPGIVHVKLWAPDGTVLYSERSELRGTFLGADEEIEEAVDGESVAETIEDASNGEAATSELPPGTKVLEEYIPVKLDGTVPAVFEIYRDAAPILAAVSDTRSAVLLVTLTASAVLAVLLYLIFRTAQARLARQTAALLEAGRRDALTGLLNHGTAVAELTTLLESARLSRAPVGVALLDVDNFRLVNETYGHDGGDRALVDVARVLREELSAGDLGRGATARTSSSSSPRRSASTTSSRRSIGCEPGSPS